MCNDYCFGDCLWCEDDCYLLFEVLFLVCE